MSLPHLPSRLPRAETLARAALGCALLLAVGWALAGGQDLHALSGFALPTR